MRKMKLPTKYLFLLVSVVILLLWGIINPLALTASNGSRKATGSAFSAGDELVRQFISEHELGKAFVGVTVRNLKTEKNVLNYNGDKYFTPASNQKLLTTWAALNEFGPDYRYKTDVFVKKGANLEREEIPSGLLIKGNGSPSFRPSELAEELSKNLGSRKVSFSGDLVLDLSEFDDTYFGPGWMWDDQNNFIGALSVPLLSYVLDSPYNKVKFLKGIGQLIQTSLSSRNITVEGGIVSGTVDESWVKILTLESPPLSQLLVNMNRFSNNFTADTIFKSLSALEGQASFSLSAELTCNYLKEAGVKGKVRIVDGSGLSRYNMIQPSQMVQLLSYAFYHPNMKEDNALRYGELKNRYLKDQNLFTSTLASWGTGTMSTREGNLAVKAKTGTLWDTSTLSGYLHTESGTLLAFSIMVNRTLDVGSARAFQTDLLKFLEERY